MHLVLVTLLSTTPALTQDPAPPIQPGWQWRFGAFTAIASISLAYVTGPITSADGSVAFPLAGFSGTPHLRLGAVW